MIASTTSDDENRYVITVAVASPANPGPAVGAWMVRLGTKTRVQVVADLGVVSTHRACLLTIAEALKAPRAHRHPIVVRCNQKAAVQALKRVGDNLVLNPGNEGLDEGELAVVDAIRAAYRSGVSRATFEFAGDSSGDADLAAVRDAARQVSDARRGS